MHVGQIWNIQDYLYFQPNVRITDAV